MYKNYVFDLYGTLVDIHTDEEQMELWEKLALFYGYYGANYEPQELKERYAALCSSKEDELKRGVEPKYAHEACPEIHIEEVFTALFAEKGVTVSDEMAVLTGQFFRVLATEYVKLYDGVPQMLAKLKEAGAGVYLLSNAQRIFTAYELNYLDITKYFDGILISSDYNTKKPDARFFALLHEKFGLDLKECIMVGNDSRCDIGGAKAAGMDCLYVRSNISPKDDPTPDATYCMEEMDIAKMTELLLQ